jgi:hypothetical protein
MDVFYWILGINIVLGIGFYFFVMEYASRKVFFGVFRIIPIVCYSFQREFAM